MKDGIESDRMITEAEKMRNFKFCDLMRWSWMYNRAISVEWCLQ